MRIGIIGVGNMGAMLARAFADTGRADVIVCNRTPEKAYDLARDTPSIRIVERPAEVVSSAELVVLATRPDDARQLMRDIAPLCSPAQWLINTVSSIPISDWEACTGARVVKMIPSITQLRRCGIILVSYGTRVDDTGQEWLERELELIGTPFALAEEQLRLGSDLTSCGPAFVAQLISSWASVAADVGTFSRAETEYLLQQTFLATADLFASGLTVNDIIRRVAVPGGVTEAGIRALTTDGENLFRRLHAATHSHSTPAVLP